jgi:putative membrane protein (TIGR04086 family)
MSEHNRRNVPSARARPERIVWWAIWLGFSVDWLTSTALGSLASLIDPSINDRDFTATSIGLVTAALFALSTGFGGWLAGRIAKHEHMLHGALVGGVGILLMVVLGMFGQSWQISELMIQFGGTLLGALGGWLSSRGRARGTQ